MSLTLTGESLRSALRDWHTERDELDSQLGESLDALTAYQSHLDLWQQQLAAERQALQQAQDELERDREEIAPAHAALEHERAEVRESREQLAADLAAADAMRVELNDRQSQLDAAQVELDRVRAELESTRNQLEADRVTCKKSTEQLDRERENLRASRERLEIELSDLQAARGQLERERSELADVRSQFDRGSAVAENQQNGEASTLRSELTAAREKISALTTSLLERTEELRTLDNRRAEAVTELELSRVREADLKSALDQHQRTAEQENQQRKEELRELRELLQCRIEDRPDDHASAVVESQVSEMPLQNEPPAIVVPLPASNPTITRQNPVLGSIVQQFDKLRQQRATDRNLGNKSR